MQKLSDREWTVLEALWQMGGAELGALGGAAAPAHRLEPQYGAHLSDPYGSQRTGAD